MGPFQGFGPNWDQVPNLGHHYEHCSCYLDFFFSETKFSETETCFRDQIFPIPKPRLFFPKPKPILFPKTKFFRYRNRDFFPKPKPKPSNIWQKFRNREVSKPKCQSLLMRFEGTNYDVFSSSLIPVTRWFS